MADKTLLELKSVSKHFQVKNGVLKAVNDVNLTIYQGETLGLVGESGCGKTTLGRTLVKLYQNDEGTILYKGKDISTYTRRENLAYHKNVQIIYQDPYASLNPLHVVRQSISEGLEIHHLYKGKKRNARVLELLDMVGLNQEHANRFPHEFSGGSASVSGLRVRLPWNPS